MQNHRKLLNPKERETGIEPATSSLGNWASIENKQQWRLLRPFLNTSTRLVSRFCLFHLLNWVEVG